MISITKNQIKQLFASRENLCTIFSTAAVYLVAISISLCLTIKNGHEMRFSTATDATCSGRRTEPNESKLNRTLHNYKITIIYNGRRRDPLTPHDSSRKIASGGILDASGNAANCNLKLPVQLQGKLRVDLKYSADI